MSDGDSSRPTVLAVDDQANVAEAYRLWLGDDYEVLTAGDGEAALSALDETVDVVLLDRQMPALSGDEALERIRESEYDCRVAMVTAVDPDFDIVDMPFDAYLRKPVSEADLTEVVERLLARSDYDRKLREYFSLAETVATLRAEKPRSLLENSEEYQRLTDRLARTEAALEETTDRLDVEALEDSFREFG